MFDTDLVLYLFVFVGMLIAATQPGVFDHVVVNDTVDGAYRELRAIVIQVSVVVVHRGGVPLV